MQLLYLPHAHLSPIIATINQPINHSKRIFPKQILKKTKGSADKINICEMDEKDREGQWHRKSAKYLYSCKISKKIESLQINACLKTCMQDKQIEGPLQKVK